MKNINFLTNKKCFIPIPWTGNRELRLIAYESSELHCITAARLEKEGKYRSISLAVKLIILLNLGIDLVDVDNLW